MVGAPMVSVSVDGLEAFELTPGEALHVAQLLAGQAHVALAGEHTRAAS
jgi:hypothetical protein